MNDFGHFALCCSWLLSVFGVVAGVVAGLRNGNRWLASAANATLLVFVCVGISLLSLAGLFLADDYTNQYVWQFSNRDMAGIYKVTAIWGGMDGSMLLWCFFLSVSAALVALRCWTYPRKLIPWALAVLNSSVLFFLTVVVFLTNPFRYLQAPFIPPDGNGLNPLLQNPYMAIHPPTLYAGFTTLAVPFAFCIAALCSGVLSNQWVQLTRRWTLAAWGFLTVGITLGGYWAYIELGWGGFWAWDPVENASFLPWLTATAFLHSVMVQERKDMLKFWNIWLIVLTYGLTVFGTFLTRSGVVQSVHAFASTDVGWVFLVYLGLIFVGTALLSYWRRQALRSARKIESIFSREAAFLMNNLIFLSICFATLWGVMFPVLSEALTGQKQAVGIPFFNAVNVPLFLILIFLMGVGPLVAWRRATISSLFKTFMWPFGIALFSGCLFLWGGITDFYPVLSYVLSVFVLLTLMGEVYRGLRAQRGASAKSSLPRDATRLFRRHRIRYGAYLIHFGVLVAAVSITASMAHKIEREMSLSEGEQHTIGPYQLTLDRVFERKEKNYEALVAEVRVTRKSDQAPVAVLGPELRWYTRGSETTTEVALRKSLREDLYLVLAGLDESGKRATFKVFLNPLQVWLWIGVAIMALGTFIVWIPRRQERYSRVRASASEAPSFIRS